MGRSPRGARTAAVALIFAAGAFAQPRASLPQASFDFGQVVRGSLIHRDFVLKNLGDAPLRIERVGLTPPILPRERLPGMVPPGGQATLRFVLDTLELNGSYRGGVHLFLNDPRLPVARLHFGGTVRSTIDLLPSPVVRVLARRGYEGSGSVEIVSRESEPLLIHKVEHPGGRFTTALETIEQGRRYRLTVNMKKDVPGGASLDEILVRTSSKTMPVLRIAAQTAALERLYPDPERLDLGQLSPARAGKPRRPVATITVYGLSGRPVPLLARSELDFLRPEALAVKPGADPQIAIHLTPERMRPGPFRGRITIYSANPAFPKLHVRVTGTVSEK